MSSGDDRRRARARRMSEARARSSSSVLDLARRGAADRQRVLDEVCGRVLSEFVGRMITPDVVAEAEGCLRNALDESIRSGTYVLPDGLRLDRVELGADLRIKVYFARIPVVGD